MEIIGDKDGECPPVFKPQIGLCNYLVSEEIITQRTQVSTWQ